MSDTQPLCIFCRRSLVARDAVRLSASQEARASKYGFADDSKYMCVKRFYCQLRLHRQYIDAVLAFGIIRKTVDVCENIALDGRSRRR